MTITSAKPTTYGSFACASEDATGRTYLEVINGLNEIAEMRGTDDVMPGAVGRFPRNRVPDWRSVELEGFVEGFGTDVAARASAFRTRMKALLAAFDPTLIDTLEVALEDGTTATLNARTIGILPEQLAAWACRVSIELESVDPDWLIA